MTNNRYAVILISGDNAYLTNEKHKYKTLANSMCIPGKHNQLFLLRSTTVCTGGAEEKYLWIPSAIAFAISVL